MQRRWSALSTIALVVGMTGCGPPDPPLALDVWYVDHWSIWLDLQILWRTVDAVIGRRGISHAGDATMPEFMGSGTVASAARVEHTG